MPKLSPRTVQTAKPKEKEYSLNDGKGLSLLVMPNGHKSWVFRYTSPALRKRRKVSLGTFPAISLKKARERQKKYLDLVQKDIDPVEHFKELERQKLAKQEGLFDKVVDEWIERQKEDLAQSTYVRRVSVFENIVKPFFKNRLIEDIKHPEIVKLTEMRALQSVDSAKRLLQSLNRLWIFAITKGYCENNIIANIDRKSILPTSSTTKHYPRITEPKIVKELIRAVYSYTGFFSVRNALRFALHLPLRASNLVNLKWEYVDFENKTITIPRQLMKLKDSNLSDFTMPLAPQVIEILKEQKLFTGETYVFKTKGYQDKPISSETPNGALKRMGFNDEEKGRKTRLHGFRGTFRSLADTFQSEHGVSFEVKERALDHLTGSLSSRAYYFSADYLNDLRKLMNWWSEFVVSMLDEVISDE